MSEMSMSPSDIAACCNGGCNGNNQWNNPMWLIWAILFGRNGGFFGNNGDGAALQSAEIQSKLNAMSQQIADNQSTNTLNSGIMSNHDYLHDMTNNVNMGFAGTNAAVNQAAMGNVIGQKDLQSAIQTCCCNNQTAILNQTNQLQSQIEGTRQAVVNGFANIGYEIAQQTNTLQNTANQNTQRILDQMCNNTTQALRDKVYEMSQQAQTASIVGQLKSSCGCGC